MKPIRVYKQERILYMAPNLAMATTLAAHDVRQIMGQAINQQQVSSRTVLPESAVEAGGNLDSFPR